MNRLDALTTAPPDTRLLTGAVAALLGLTLLTAVQIVVPDLSWKTPAGLIAPLDLAGVFAAMLLGGFIARQRRFRWLAPALQLVAVVCTLATYVLFDTGAHDAARDPRNVVRLNALPALLTLLLAFAGAIVGERLAMRGGQRPDVAP